MFHVKHKALAIALLLGSIFNARGQGSFLMTDKPFIHRQFEDSVLRGNLERNSAYLKLNGDEQEFFYWVNVLRKDPSAFGRHYVLPFMTQFPELYGQDSKSLEEDLHNTQPLEPFQPDATLNRTAHFHAMDLAEHQKPISHFSTKGESFPVRMEMAGIRTCAAENLYDGKNEPLKALIMLLIDFGIKGHGHRKALLRSDFREMGVAIIPRPEQESFAVVVQHFSCQ